MLTAAIHGPGGAWISGTKQSETDDWSIVWGINTTFSAEWAGTDAAAALAKIEGDMARLEGAKTWIRYMANGAALAALDEKARQHRDPIRRGYVDLKLTGTVDPLMESIQTMINATLAKVPIPPQAFDKDEMLRVLERAKAYDQRPRWKVAVESREVFMAAYGDKLIDADAPGRMENLTGTYGSLLDIPVIVDPEIKGWEIRDAVTGEKVQFVTDPTTGTHHWLANNDGHAMAEAIKRNATKSKDGMARSLAITNAYDGKGGEQNGETGTDGNGSREQAEDAS